MMKLIQSMASKSDFYIPLVLFFSSFFIYDYNLSGQPWHGDEVTYLGWGGNYFHLLTNVDFNNPCLISLDTCHQLFHIPAFGLTYSPLRDILIGLPMYLTNHDGGNFYDWSCYWDCYNSHNGPTIEEMTAGRLLSPLFGSLTIVFSFWIGKMLFNKSTGIIISLFFMFYDLWIWYSRSIMVEIHYVFFALLSLVLLLHSLKTNQPKITYFILSAILFGVAINSKMLAMAFSGLFFGIILFKGLTERRSEQRKYNVRKTTFLITSFFAISLLGIFLVEPGFYQNPINEIKTMKTDMDNYNHDVWYIGYPTVNNIQIKSMISVFHFLILPSFIEKQIYNPDLNMNGNFGWTYPPTYSSIPMSIFFFIGFGYLVYRLVKSRNWVSNESLLVIWFVSTLILSLVIVKDFSLERYLLPLEIPVIFIASYGLWNFVKNISNTKIRILFVSLSIFVHSMTSLSYFDKIYFSPGTTWVNPLHYGTLQQSLDNSFTFGANLLFVGALLLVMTFCLKRKTHLETIDSKNC